MSQRTLSGHALQALRTGERAALLLLLEDLHIARDGARPHSDVLALERPYSPYAPLSAPPQTCGTGQVHALPPQGSPSCSASDAACAPGSPDRQAMHVSDRTETGRGAAQSSRLNDGLTKHPTQPEGSDQQPDSPDLKTPTSAPSRTLAGGCSMMQRAKFGQRRETVASPTQRSVHHSPPRIQMQVDRRTDHKRLQPSGRYVMPEVMLCRLNSALLGLACHISAGLLVWFSTAHWPVGERL